MHFSKLNEKVDIEVQIPEEYKPEECVVHRSVYKIVNVDETPKFLHEPYILSGYRVYFTLELCLKSLFRLHNETLNVWTHLVGFFAYLWLTIHTLTHVVPAGDYEAAIVLSMFLVAVMCCMICSATFHLFLCHSEAAYAKLLRADLTGIAAQIFGSYVPGIYYGFACYPTWRIVYFMLVSIIFLVGLIAPCFPRFHSRDWRIVRVLTYAGMSAFGLIPLLHWIAVRGAVHEQERFIIWLFMLMFALYGVGVVFYITKIPERWSPGRFDVWLHSHQWWHLCVMSAPAVYYYISIQQLQMQIAGLISC